MKDNIDQQQLESKEAKQWKEFWKSESPGLMLYACLHGTVEIVKYFISKFVSPTARYIDNRMYKRHTVIIIHVCSSHDAILCQRKVEHVSQF